MPWVKVAGSTEPLDGALLVRHAVAQREIEDSREFLSARGFPGQVALEPSADGLAAQLDGAGVEEGGHLAVGVSNALQVLLDHALAVEMDLSSRGNHIAFVPSLVTVRVLDGSGQVEGGRGALIADGDSPVVIDLEDPVIVDALRRDVQRPLADRIRIGSELVRLTRESIRLTGSGESVLGDAVRLLGALVRLEREEHTSNSDESGGESNEQ